MIRIALIGCGRIGQMHAANLDRHNRTELSMVFDADQQSAQTVARTFGVQSVNSAEEIFSSSNVDGVLIASVTSTHADFIEMCVAAGKPVLCEKPIDLDLLKMKIFVCAENLK